MEKRNTIQKQLVLDAVFRLANHPTAEEVYAEVARSHPTVSKATVYRNLGSLSEDGRFDQMLLEHHHIICTQCGCFADAPASGSAALDEAVARQTGYSGVSHDIVFRGLCPECAKAGKV